MSIIRRTDIAKRLQKYVLSVQGKTGRVKLDASDVQAEGVKKSNLTATSNPSQTDDSTKGYEVLSKWMNTTTGNVFTCLNTANGNAVWKDNDINIADLGSSALKNIGTTDDEVPTVSTVKGLIPAPQTKTSLGLDQIDNTLDINKPVSAAQQLAIQDAIDLIKSTFEDEIENAIREIDYSNLINKPALFSGDYSDLVNKPVLFDGNYNSLTNKPAIFDGKYTSLTEVPNFFDGKWTSLTDKPVLFDGHYSSLSGLPSLFDGEYSSLKNKPTLFSESYNDLKDKPLLFDGKYASLSGLPSLFNGTYAALTGKPTLFDGNYNSLTNLPSLFSGSWLNLTDKPALFSGNYADLTNKPNLFDGRFASLSGVPTLFDGTYATLTGKPVLFSGSYADLTNKPVLFDGKYTSLTGTPTLFSGSYNDLTNKPTIPTTTTNITEGANLYYTPARVQAYLDSKGIRASKYFEVSTDANSVWTLDVSGLFSSVDFVTPIALSPMAGTLPLVTEQRTAHLISFSNIAAIKGTVTKSNTLTTLLISAGGQGLTLGGAGLAVKVKVEGILK